MTCALTGANIHSCISFFFTLISKNDIHVLVVPNTVLVRCPAFGPSLLLKPHAYSVKQ